MSKYLDLIRDEDGEYEYVTKRMRLRKFGAWLITEKIQQDKLAKAQARQILNAVELAKRIAKDRNIDPEEAFNMIQSQDSPEAALILTDYMDEARKILDSGESRAEQEARVITIFMRQRAEGFFDNNWVALSDWEVEDTVIFDDKLREKLVDFINQEQAGASTIESDDDETEEAKEAGASEGNSPGSSEPKETVKESSKRKTTGTAATPE